MANVSQLPAMAPEAAPEANPNPYETSAGYMGQAGDIYKDFAGGGALENINAYLNPYYEQVISNTIGRMDEDRAKGLGVIGDQAIAAGAFGSGRHGLAEGEFMSGYNQNIGDMTANMQMANYNQAAAMSRQDMLTGAGGLTGLGNQYYQIGNDIADRQMNAGNMQQQLMQAILSGGAEQYNQMINSPQQMLGLFSALLSSDPRQGQGSTTASSTPGLFDYLSLGAGVVGAGLQGGAWGG